MIPAPVIIGGGRIVAYNADCRDVLRDLVERDERVHAMHSDPPYHLTSIVKRFGAADAAATKCDAFGRATRGFMGKEWDGGDVAFDPATWALHLAALLPGGYLTAFASSRGFGRMSVAIEDAGFINHPMLGWIFGSGMPKATRLKAPDTDHLRYGGQALKPALEPVYMGQKPMEGTGTVNWLAHGTGVLDIDAARVPISDSDDISIKNPHTVTKGGGDVMRTGLKASCYEVPSGRWPANVVHDGSPEVMDAFADFGDLQSGANCVRRQEGYFGAGDARHGGLGRAGDVQTTYGDTGSAARFFYEAKADEDDRWFFCRHCDVVAPSRAMGAHKHDLPDLKHIVSHPTVKPLALARWLVRLTCPTRGQTVFDGFAGTGTTGVACLAEGRRAILVERDPDYFRILVARCQHYAGEGRGVLPERAAKAIPTTPALPDLFTMAAQAAE